MTSSGLHKPKALQKRKKNEITSTNEEYFKRGKLTIELLGQGISWHDGEHIEDFRTSSFIETIQKDRFIHCMP